MTKDTAGAEHGVQGAAPLSTDELAQLVASLLLERKGEDVAILGMSEVLPITDYFILATGRNSRHVESMMELVEKRMKELDVPRINRTGRDTKTWVLLDYGPFVVHLFQPDAREYYSLERLWADAERIELPEEPNPSPDSPPA